MTNKITILPLFLLTMCAPAPVTPLEVTDLDMEKMLRMVENVRYYKSKQTRTKPSDAINSALDSFWEEQNGSNDTPKS